MDSPVDFPNRGPVIHGWLSGVPDADDQDSRILQPSPSTHKRKLRTPLASIEPPNLVSWGGKRRRVAAVDAAGMNATEETEVNSDATPKAVRSRLDLGLRPLHPSGPSSPTRSSGSTSRSGDGLENKSPKHRRSRKAPRPAPGFASIDITDDAVLSLPPPPSHLDYSNALRSAPSVPASASMSSLSSASTTSRTRSPVRDMADLRMAKKPIRRVVLTQLSQLPADVCQLYLQVLAFSDGIGIIPPTVKDLIQENTNAEPVREHMLSISPTSSLRSSSTSTADTLVNVRRLKRQLERQFETFLEIRDASNRCIMDGAPEAAWNEEVHARMLDHATKEHAGIRKHNITSARPIPWLVPEATAVGETLESKLVDYCVTLSDISEARIMQVLLQQPKGPLQSSINGTAQTAVRWKPIVLNIEAKPDCGADPLPQLGVWVATHFNRLRTLTARSEDEEQHTVSITLPLLAVNGSRWSLMFASDGVDGIEILSDVFLGDTTKILGCYKVAAALDCLFLWANTTFRAWFEKNVMGEEVIVRR